MPVDNYLVAALLHSLINRIQSTRTTQTITYIISKIPGNLFIRPFEELTTSKNEKMLGDMESRVMNRLDDIVHRLDGIDVRLDAIEQCCLKESDDDIGRIKLHHHLLLTAPQLVESFGDFCLV